MKPALVMHAIYRDKTIDNSTIKLYEFIKYSQMKSTHDFAAIHKDRQADM